MRVLLLNVQTVHVVKLRVNVVLMKKLGLDARQMLGDDEQDNRTGTGKEQVDRRRGAWWFLYVAHKPTSRQAGKKVQCSPGWRCGCGF